VDPETCLNAKDRHRHCGVFSGAGAAFFRPVSFDAALVAQLGHPRWSNTPLTNDHLKRLGKRIHRLRLTASCVAVEARSSDSADPDVRANRREQWIGSGR